MTNKIIGIFGGGQLGKMICLEAHKLGFKTAIFCPEQDNIASFCTNKSFIANYDDKKALDEFIDYVDIATLEFENIPVETISYVAQKIPVFPDANILKITQNRLLEKSFLQDNSIKTANFTEIKTLNDLENGLKNFNFKAILKTATLGYDGKGQYILDKNSNLEEILRKNQTNQLILEEFVSFSQEFSIIICRNQKGQTSCYDPLTNIHKNNILDESIYPAQISDKTQKQAKDIAIKIAQKLNLYGILAIEFFLLKDETILVNELAPRPHNSGHFSMDAAITSQFEQMIRAITNLTFGNNQFIQSGKMKNLIGDDIKQVDQYFSNLNAKIHIYGKKQIKEGRKMGHINIIKV